MSRSDLLRKPILAYAMLVFLILITNAKRGWILTYPSFSPLLLVERTQRENPQLSALVASLVNQDISSLNVLPTPVLKALQNFHRSEYLYNAALAQSYTRRSAECEAITKEVMDILTSRMTIDTNKASAHATSSTVAAPPSA